MTIADPEDIPRGLVWMSDEEAGIRRRRSGKGFSYRRADGGAVDEETRRRIQSLAIPPAWTDVWICASPRGHLQATGRDARGRKQYRYHPDFREHRDAAKFDRMVDFGNALGPLRKQVDADLELTGVPKPKVTALVVRLLEETLVRVGNEEYARDNSSYGLTTLRNRHAQFSPSGLRLVFKAKSGARTDVTLADRRLRNLVRKCQDLPGQVLFQYLDETDEAHPITSTDVNDYLRLITGEPVTAKDFRTWKATVMGAVELAALPAPESERDARSAMAAVVEGVAAALRNTPTVCRTSYIHPALFDSYRAGELHDLWSGLSGRGPARLTIDERKLLRLLTTLERRQAA